MAIQIPTNTACWICIAPALDKTDGITPETAITVANSTTTLIANSGTESAPTLVLDNVAGNDATNTIVHITNDDAGAYYLKLTAANNNRYGTGMLIVFDTATYVTIFAEIEWVSSQYWNFKYGTTAAPANVKLISDDSDAADNCELMFDGTGYAGGTAKLQVDLVDAPNATALNAIADALLKRDWTAITGEASRSMLNALRFIRNKWTVIGTTLSVKKEDDSTEAWNATLTTSSSADKITGSDPS